VSVNGTIAPGAGAGTGTLVTGDETWNGGGSYLWEINSTNAAGADCLNITGALNVAAPTGNPFTVTLRSLTSSNQPGWLAGFDPARNYTWTIASASGGVSGFSPAKVALNTSGFSNVFTGTFTLTNIGNTLAVNYAGAASAPVIAGMTRLANGSFQLSFTGTPGQAFSVRGTNNLSAPLSLWPALTNGTIGAGGSVMFNDATASTNSQLFYRVTFP
jgi:hypothetical protein